MLDAARRLIDAKGDEFTTQELVAEAGVALQTFYRYFASKDELLLAVIGDAMTDACERWADAAAELPDHLARLRYYLTSTLELLEGDGNKAATARSSSRRAGSCIATTPRNLPRPRSRSSTWCVVR